MTATVDRGTLMRVETNCDIHELLDGREALFAVDLGRSDFVIPISEGDLIGMRSNLERYYPEKDKCLVAKVLMNLKKVIFFVD